MKMYNNGILPEWSRKLRSKYGNSFRLYGTEEETMLRWHEHLSQNFGYKFEFKEDQEETLKSWSKLIGG